MDSTRKVLQAQVRGVVPLHPVKRTGRAGQKVTWVSLGKVNFLAGKFQKEKENKVSNLVFHMEKENKVSNLMFHKEKENKVSNLIFKRKRERRTRERRRKQYLPHEQRFPAGMSMRTDGRGKGFKGKEKGKKGEGRYYDERRIFANSSEEAQHNLNSWVMQHRNFVFHPRHLNEQHINLWKGTGEHKLNLLKNIHRHVRERPACLEEILGDMVRTSHWPVDRLNRMEKQRQGQHKGFADGRSSVSRFTTRA